MRGLTTSVEQDRPLVLRWASLTPGGGGWKAAACAILSLATIAQDGEGVNVQAFSASVHL